MSDLYWIAVLGNLITFIDVVCVISALATALSFILFIASSNECGCEKPRAICKKTGICSFVVLATLMIVSVFIPSKKDLCLIYGVGGTMDYLKSNPTAKQLPDKCVKALDKWLDNTMNDNEEKGGEK